MAFPLIARNTLPALLQPRPQPEFGEPDLRQCLPMPASERRLRCLHHAPWTPATHWRRPSGKRIRRPIACAGGRVRSLMSN